MLLQIKDVAAAASAERAAARRCLWQTLSLIFRSRIVG